MTPTVPKERIIGVEIIVYITVVEVCGKCLEGDGKQFFDR